VPFVDFSERPERAEIADDEQRHAGRHRGARCDVALEHDAVERRASRDLLAGLARRVLRIRDAEVLEGLLSAANLGLRHVELLLGSDPVGRRPLALLLRDRLVGEQPSRSRLRVTRVREFRLQTPPLGDGLAILRPRVVNDMAVQFGEQGARAHAVSDLDQRPDHVALDHRADARGARLVQGEDGSGLDRVGDRHHPCSFDREPRVGALPGGQGHAIRCGRGRWSRRRGRRRWRCRRRATAERVGDDRRRSHDQREQQAAEKR
jgi:hypothetical protein